jgi:hypothetical protein
MNSTVKIGLKLQESHSKISAQKFRKLILLNWSTCLLYSRRVVRKDDAEVHRYAGLEKKDPSI